MNKSKQFLLVAGVVALGAAGIVYYQGQQSDGQVLSDQVTTAKAKKTEGGKITTKNLPPVKANADSPDAIIAQILRDANDEDVAAKPTDNELSSFSQDDDEISSLSEVIHE